ncbi:MAG TPA: cation:proton antiporter, partial [Marmoricola sp.]|nr:cation:proton antiporter [Marmoricola sp.]
PRGWHLPVVLGELVAGAVLGKTGFGYLHSSDPTFTFLGNIGFALVMFIAGTHVPVRDPKIRPALAKGAVRAVVVGVIAGGLGYALAGIVGIGHGPLYAVLTASSSAAIILPIIDSLGLKGDGVLGLLPQVAIADAACIVALPLAIDPPHAARAANGALAVIATAVVVFLILRDLEHRGVWKKVHDLSEDRSFALELRSQLTILFGIAAVAVQTHVSIMLAGFAFGLAVAAIGEPRRLAKQLFAVTEGFLGPVYFVWLGAELNLRELFSHPKMIGLAIGLAVAAGIAHGLMVLFKQAIPYGMLAAAQLGVPVSAATIGSQLHLLKPGEGSALMLGAILTIGISIAGGSLVASRAGKTVAATN